MSALIVCEGLTKRFGDILAVDVVNLTIEEGEFFALLGPSGCGKTTLLRMLAGLEAPSAGRIRIDGVDITEAPPNKRPVNMVFQSYALFPHMSVAQNVAYGLKVSGVAEAERRSRVAEALELVQLPDYGARAPDELSGGQRQRVALARALVKRPRVLLLDEPLSALDAKLREQMRFELKRIQTHTGITFVFVTHDQDEALSLSDRCAVMQAGRLQQLGPPADIYERPNSRWVADFIGQVNLFAGLVERVEDAHIFVRAAELDATVALERDANTRIALGQSVWIALRPEKIALEKAASPASGGTALAGVIRQISYLGGGSLYEVELAAGARVKSVRLNPSPRDPAQFQVGEPVRLAWQAWSPTLLLI
jgi:spermidine/putrescine transport system ATP-binding protein